MNVSVYRGDSDSIEIVSVCLLCACSNDALCLRPLSFVRLDTFILFGTEY